MTKRAVIIDTDPGIDDALAIALALFSDQIEIKLFTTVAGNVSLDKVTNNLLKLEAFWQSTVPVAKGAKLPLVAVPINATEVHGESGMDGFDFPEPSHHLLLDEVAVTAMYQTIMENDDKTTIVALGPLTNIALLIRTYPNVLEKIDELILMGGAIGRGNVGIYSEFNIAADPEAAEIVIRSSLKITIAPLEVGKQAKVYQHESLEIKQLNQTGEMIYELFQRYRGGSIEDGIEMYDSCAVGYLLHPEFFSVKKAFVEIERYGEYTKGATLIDFDKRLQNAHTCQVCTNIDDKLFKKWVIETIEKA